MIYRNGIKEYLVTGLLFGTAVGLLFGIQYKSALLGIFCAAFCGVFFAASVWLFSVLTERKFKKLRTAISKVRKVICDGGATHKGNGGWLFLTNEALEFYPHKLNRRTKDVTFYLRTVKSAETKRNKLIITLTNGNVEPIVVAQVKEWKRQVDKILNTTEK